MKTPSIRATHGAQLSCKGWQQEAALRMAMNSVDADVTSLANESSDPTTLDDVSLEIVFNALRKLADDETLVIDGSAPAHVMATTNSAPRVLIGRSGTCWANLGTQRFLYAAYAALAVASQQFGHSLAGKLVAACGMGLKGGAVPPAVTMNGGAYLGIDADAERIKRSVKAGHCDVMVTELEEALRILKNAVRKREAASVGLVGHYADVLDVLAKRGIVPDLLTGEDTPATQPSSVRKLQSLGSVIFTADEQTLVERNLIALSYVALSGEPSDIYRSDQLAIGMFPDDMLTRWLTMARRRGRFQGLPSRTCWLTVEGALQFGLALNKLVMTGEVSAPLVLFSLSTANQRPSGTNAKNESEAGVNFADLVNSTSRLVDVARGASWLSLESSLNSGIQRIVVADGTLEMNTRIERVLSHDAHVV